MTSPKMMLWLMCVSTIFVWSACTVEAMEDVETEVVYEQYLQKENELGQFNDLLQLLKDEGLKEEATLDSALLTLVKNKIDKLETEYQEFWDKLLDLPMYAMFEKFLPSVEYAMGKTNMDQVRKARLDKVNGVRSSMWIHNYKYSKVLDHSAQERAEELALKYSSDKSMWAMATHQRDNQPVAWYHHKTLWKWFADRGIKSVVVWGSNYTENTGYWSYRCNDEDCTDNVISAIMKTFRFYMNEQPYNWPHYRSLVSSNYSYIGLWLACVNAGNGWDLKSCDMWDIQSWRYWLVIHYSTEFKQPKNKDIIKNEWYGEYLPL